MPFTSDQDRYSPGELFKVCRAMIQKNGFRPVKQVWGEIDSAKGVRGPQGNSHAPIFYEYQKEERTVLLFAPTKDHDYKDVPGDMGITPLGTALQRYKTFSSQLPSKHELLIPIGESRWFRQHWVFLHITIEGGKTTAIFYDAMPLSFVQSSVKGVLNALMSQCYSLAYIDAMVSQHLGVRPEPRYLEQQDNDHDCGPFTVENMSAIVVGKKPDGALRISPEIRKMHNDHFSEKLTEASEIFYLDRSGARQASPKVQVFSMQDPLDDLHDEKLEMPSLASSFVDIQEEESLQNSKVHTEEKEDGWVEVVRDEESSEVEMEISFKPVEGGWVEVGTLKRKSKPEVMSDSIEIVEQPETKIVAPENKALAEFRKSHQKVCEVFQVASQFAFLAYKSDAVIFGQLGEQYNIVKIHPLGGLVFYIFSPREVSKDPSQPIDIYIAFKGTPGGAKDMSAIIRDLDTEGAGHTSFQACEHVIMEAFQKVVNEFPGREINIHGSGHSLGGGDLEKFLAPLLEKMNNSKDKNLMGIKKIECTPFSTFNGTDMVMN